MTPEHIEWLKEKGKLSEEDLEEIYSLQRFIDLDTRRCSLQYQKYYKNKQRQIFQKKIENERNNK